jgi:uncharacterized protein (DUF433 family)
MSLLIDRSAEPDRVPRLPPVRRLALGREVKALARRLWQRKRALPAGVVIEVHPEYLSGEPQPERTMAEPSVIHSDPEILGGTPVFVGTRVPLKNLIDYLEGGHPLDEFLDDFPTVTREQVLSVLDEAQEALSQRARAA